MTSVDLNIYIGMRTGQTDSRPDTRTQHILVKDETGDDRERPLRQRQALGPATQDCIRHLRGVLHPGDQGYQCRHDET